MILKEHNEQVNKVLATLESYKKHEKKITLLDRHLKRAMDIDDDKYQWYLRAMVHTLQGVRESKIFEEEEVQQQENPEEPQWADIKVELDEADKENSQSPVKECLMRANTLHS